MPLPQKVAEASGFATAGHKKQELEMDKKDLFAIVTDMVEQLVREYNIPEPMARGLVGFVLTKNKDALVESVRSIAGIRVN